MQHQNPARCAQLFHREAISDTALDLSATFSATSLRVEIGVFNYGMSILICLP